MNTKKKNEFLDIQSLLVKYLKYWKWFLISVIATSILAVAYIKIADPVYYITASVKLKEDATAGSQLSSSVSKNIGFNFLGGGNQVVEDEASIMASQSNMRKMIYDLGLYTSYTYKQFPFDKSLYNKSPLVIESEKNIIDTLSNSLEFFVKVTDRSYIEIKVEVEDEEIGKYNYKLESLPATIKTSYGDFLLRASGKVLKTDPKDYKLEISLSGLDYAAEVYRKKIGIAPPSKKSELLILSLEDTDRQRGKDALNKLIAYYNEEGLTEKNEMARKAVEFISERIVHISAEVEVLEKNVEEFKKRNNLTNIEAETKVLFEQFGKLQERSLSTEVQLEVANMLENIITDPANKYTMIPISFEAPETVMVPVTAYNEALLERTTLLRSSNESNPAMIILNGRIEALRENVVASIRNMRKDIEVQKNYFKSFEGEMASKMSQMPRQEREYVDIQRQLYVKAELYVFLLTKKEETQLILASETPKAKVINDAYNYWKPVSPRKMIVLLIGFILGLVIPVLVIYITDTLKVKVKSKEELEELTSLPVLGEIGLSKEKDIVAVREGVDNSIAELFRLVRTNLQFYLKKDKKVMLVTSSISGEGKSFFTINLAMSFSLIKNKKIVLVGLDIRNPKLSDYMSVKTKDGMTVYLASDDMKPEDIVLHQPQLHPNFYFVPAGPIPPNPSELLLSDRLDEFFDYLRANFDYIIVDTAPVGMVADTFTIDRVADKTVYLFRASYTNKSYLRFAESLQDSQKLKNVSLVINGTSTKTAYGYGYKASTK